MSPGAIRALAASIAILLVSQTTADAAQPQLYDVVFQSSLLSSFFGQPVQIGASVLLPPSYYRDPARRYPVVYVVPAFEEIDEVGFNRKEQWQVPMHWAGREFIIVFLQAMMDIDNEEVHTEFADSATNGPWGAALTTEFIPQTDAHFRTIASGNARFLFGHSSGGWSLLWLQINYPGTFNAHGPFLPTRSTFTTLLDPT